MTSPTNEEMAAAAESLYEIYRKEGRKSHLLACLVNGLNFSVHLGLETETKRRAARAVVDPIKSLKEAP